uniref:BZIP domain-containing protein n=1 Tax=Megaselia scalaris TaxID=36166 RepID=T1GXJ9_MEGSC
CYQFGDKQQNHKVQTPNHHSPEPVKDIFPAPIPMDYHSPTEYPLPSFNRFGAYSVFFSRRQRGEKRPIPDEQKDDKYYERRKRNNEAAKKSRDARKIREDRIAFRAAILEQENAILRAQLLAMRDEVSTLRQLISARQAQISVNI